MTVPAFILLSYLFLLFTIITIVIDLGKAHQIKAWYVLFVVSLLFGWMGGVVNALGTGYVLLLGCLCFLFVKQQKGGQALLLIFLSIPLFFHFAQFGFHNYPFLDQVKVTPDAVPYSLYFNYDKTLLPVFVMGFSTDHISRKKWLEIFKKLVQYLLVLAPLMLGLSWALGYVHFVPKYPPYTLVWMLVNLFFTCTAEEIVFRGIIQQQLEKHITVPHKGYVAIAITALLFGVMHYAGGMNYILLATIAGLFYGHIFYATKEIRSSVFLHFMLNMLHFLLFTYPAIAR